jgi:hypothetical protein
MYLGYWAFSWPKSVQKSLKKNEIDFAHTAEQNYPIMQLRVGAVEVMPRLGGQKVHPQIGNSPIMMKSSKMNLERKKSRIGRL